MVPRSIAIFRLKILLFSLNNQRNVGYMAATMAVGLVVSRFGSFGAELSTIGVVMAITCGELYLWLKGAKFAKRDNSVVTGSGIKV